MALPADRVHLDSAGGAPLWPEVKDAMFAALDEGGNPSTPHASGRRARQLLERARAQVAALINAKPSEIYFTSCATEANGWALRGLLSAYKRPRPHLIISSIEHPSITLAARRLEMEGVSVTLLPVDRDGRVDSRSLEAALTADTVLVSIMLANGEVGTIQPLAELAAIARGCGALFHTDAVAAVGYHPVDTRALGVDALTLSPAAWHGPTGIAALFARETKRILPLLDGGGQERGARSGTENVPAAAGFGLAAEKAKQKLTPDGLRHLASLRDRLKDGLMQRLDRIRLNGSWTDRLPQNLHLCVDGVAGESLALALDQAGLAVGLGSACNAKAMRPSHVLKAMGLTNAEAQGAVSLTLSWMTADADIDRALEIFPDAAERLRRLTALTLRA